MSALAPTRPALRRAGGPAAAPAVTPRLDWVLVGAVLALLALGMLLVWSATSHRPGADPAAYVGRQLANAAVGLGLMLLTALAPARRLRLGAPMLYLAALAGLVLVLVAGATVNGSRSWLVLGGLSVQPSELAKPAVVVGMALVVARRAAVVRAHRVGSVDVLLMLAVAAVPGALILAQPDLGTLLVLAGTVFGVLGAAGAPRRWLAGLALAGATAAVAAVRIGLLADYQVDRFLAFTDPGLDPRGAGYNAEQARIAIGNGGWLGQGLFHGSQTRAGFVPEQHTDFVFTVAGEELGLVGAGLLIGLLGVVVWRALRVARSASDTFGRLVAAGVACWLAFQAFWNVGMCLGIMPVTGVPLPFLSYGGSALIAVLLGVGLVLHVHRRAADPALLTIG